MPRQMAYMLWKESMDAQNIRHPMQGVANLAKAAIGGYQLYKADETDRQRAQAISDALKNLPGMGDASGDVPASPAAPATAPADGEPPMDRSIKLVPASMRNNNPGAMWPGPSASTYGSTGSQNVAGNNKIATFPDAVSGGAAQFDLLNRKYTGMPLADALRKWSGGNNVESYIGGVTKATGLAPDAMITADLLRGPQGVALARAMARHETGRDFPMSPDQWVQAQDRVFNPGAGAPRAPLPLGASAPPVPAMPSPAGPVDPAQVPIGTTLPPPDVPAMPPAATQAPKVAPAAPASPPAAAATPPAPQVRSPQLTPAQQAEIRTLWADPATRPIALQKYQEYSKPKEQWVPFTSPDGSAMQRNALTGEVKPQGGDDKVINQVQYAQNNWKSLGFPDPASTDPKAQQFWRQHNANRLGGVSTMIDQRAPDAFETHYGEGMAKQALGTIEAGNAAALGGQKIQLAQKMLQDIQTGKVTPATATVGAWMQAVGIDPARFGINPATPMTAEALTGITNEMVLGKIGAGGMPANNFSDADRKFLQQTATSLADRPEANFLKLEMARRVNDLQAQKSGCLGYCSRGRSLLREIREPMAQGHAGEGHIRRSD
jgi:hypothetical protein